MCKKKKKKGYPLEALWICHRILKKNPFNLTVLTFWLIFKNRRHVLISPDIIGCPFINSYLRGKKWYDITPPSDQWVNILISRRRPNTNIHLHKQFWVSVRVTHFVTQNSRLIVHGFHMIPPHCNPRTVNFPWDVTWRAVGG